jgi:hypothetical protein
MIEEHKCNCENKSLEADKSNSKWIVVNQITINVFQFITTLVIVYCLFLGCTGGIDSVQKSKELEIKERELIIREKELDHKNLELQKIKELEK